MTNPRCPICGLECFETSLGNWWCPNHGKVIENTLPESEPVKDGGYIG